MKRTIETIKLRDNQSIKLSGIKLGNIFLHKSINPSYRNKLKFSITLLNTGTLLTMCRNEKEGLFIVKQITEKINNVINSIVTDEDLRKHYFNICEVIKESKDKWLNFKF